MKRKKGKPMIALVLTALLFSAAGCRTEEPEEEPIDGGTVTHWDSNAPKVIKSRDIKSFEAAFFLNCRWTSKTENGSDFHFVITEENGTPMASETIVGVKAPADGALLESLQEIIERHELVKKNGLYDVTAGLPPEFQPGGITVTYASGETLTFTTDNDPDAEWAEEVYDVFAEWFFDQGEEALYPKPETSLITRVIFEYMEDGKSESYSGVNVPEEKAIEGETHLLNQDFYDPEADPEFVSKYILFPEDYYERVTEIIAGTDLIRHYDFSIRNPETGDLSNHDCGYYGMGDKTTKDHEEDTEGLSLEIYLDYESGKRVRIETSKASEIEAMKPIADALLEYHRSLFE